jgi:hypothetical protein
MKRHIHSEVKQVLSKYVSTLQLFVSPLYLGQNLLIQWNRKHGTQMKHQ